MVFVNPVIYCDSLWCLVSVTLIVAQDYYISGNENKWNVSMAVHGALAVFNPREEHWSEYSERLTFYFIANRIKSYGCKEESCFLSCCGPTTFRLLRSLVLLGKLHDFSFKEFVTK